MTQQTTTTDKTNKPKTKRRSKGERLHIRRMKQAQRKEATYTTPQVSPAKPVKSA
jgi:hypothetical protein